MNPLVTLGVCVKDCESLIRKVIENILDQNYPHELLEVIFVDDGSKDGTLSIILTQAPSMDVQTKIIHQEWKGLGFARNVVVDNACGKYIIWIDGDMILSKDYIRIQVEFMEQNPNAGICKGKYGILNGTKMVAKLENIDFAAEGGKNEMKSTSMPLGTGGSIYRVKAIRQVGGFDKNIRGAGEDLDAEYRIRAAGWSLHRNSAVFYEIPKETWRALWNEYFWQGYGVHYFTHKIRAGPYLNSINITSPVAILKVLIRSLNAYKLICRKSVFLLLLHWIFKRTAWCLGFIKAHTEEYGHTCAS